MERNKILILAKQAGMAGLATTVVCEITELERFAQLVAEEVSKECSKVPDVLFDVGAVLEALDDKAKSITCPENVSDVLDAVVRIMRSNALANAPASAGD